MCYVFRMAEKKKRGRPKLPKGKERGCTMTLRVNVAERARLRYAAREAGQSFSDWARTVLLAASPKRVRSRRTTDR